MSPAQSKAMVRHQTAYKLHTLAAEAHKAGAPDASAKSDQAHGASRRTEQ